MKLAKMLFIFLIGMISFTTLASTPVLEQKPKTTIEKFVKTEIVGTVLIVDQVSASNFSVDDESNFLVTNQNFNFGFKKCNFKSSFNLFKIPLIDGRNLKINYNYSIDKAKYFSSIGIKDSKRYLCEKQKLRFHF